MSTESLEAIEVPDNVIPLDPDARDRHEKKVYEVWKNKVAANEAEAIIREQEAKERFTFPRIFTTAAEALAEDWPIEKHAIEGMLLEEENALIVAQQKTGKTDLMYNIVRSYCDNVPFLDEFAVLPLDSGRTIVMLDFEMTHGSTWRHFAQLGVKNLDRCTIISMKGTGWNLTTDFGFNWLVETLKELNCQVLIVDPLAPAFGGEENSNSEVTAWTKRFDQMKLEAGLRECYITTHTGRMEAEEGKERSRGATRWDDWAGAIWTYTQDTEPGTDTPGHHRFLQVVKGREVKQQTIEVAWQASTRQISYLGQNTRMQSRETKLQNKVLLFINTHPDSSVEDIKSGVGGNKAAAGTAIKALVGFGLVDQAKGGQKGTALVHTISATGKFMLDRIVQQGLD